MDCDCCYRNSCGNFCSMCGRNVGNKGKCLEDTGRTSGGVIPKQEYEEMYAIRKYLTLLYSPVIDLK